MWETLEGMVREKAQEFIQQIYKEDRGQFRRLGERAKFLVSAERSAERPRSSVYREEWLAKLPDSAEELPRATDIAASRVR